MKVNHKLELWKSALESTSRIKMTCIECIFSKIGNNDEGGVRIEDHEVLRMIIFWFLGSIDCSLGEED